MEFNISFKRIKTVIKGKVIILLYFLISFYKFYGVFIVLGFIEI